MRRLPQLDAAFDAARTPAHAIVVSKDLRRTLRKGIGKSAHGWFPSRKMATAIEYASTDQADGMSVLELRPDVRAFSTWPLLVRFLSEAGVQEWTPSLGVHMTDGRRVALDMLGPKEMVFFQATSLDVLVSRALRSVGVAYRRLDRTGFRRSHAYRNAVFVAQHRVSELDEDLAGRVEDLLARDGRASLSDIRTALLPMVGTVATVCRMAWQGRVALDLEADMPLLMTARLLGKETTR